tara:strand:- start:60 stop:1220 length:1161 start_codon:yes stop_codon:yes gene_type:complete
MSDIHLCDEARDLGREYSFSPSTFQLDFCSVSPLVSEQVARLLLTHWSGGDPGQCLLTLLAIRPEERYAFCFFDSGPMEEFYVRSKSRSHKYKTEVAVTLCKEMLHLGSCPERMACSLSEPFSKWWGKCVFEANDVRDFVLLVRSLADTNSACRTMLHVSTLYDCLASHLTKGVEEEGIADLARLLVEREGEQAMMHVLPVVRASAEKLLCHLKGWSLMGRPGHHIPSDVALQTLLQVSIGCGYGCILMGYLVGMVDYLPRTEELTLMIMERMPEHFLLQLDKKGRLDAFYQAATGRLAVLARNAWPAKASEACNDEHTSEEKERSPFVCPITLERCVHPAVAADGRVYERDSIMRHFATRGVRSPVTNLSLPTEALVTLYSTPEE